MGSKGDPLHEYDMKNWDKLHAALMSDWPRSILIKRWIEVRSNWFAREPEKFPFYVLCPYGDYNNGLVMFGFTNGCPHWAMVYNFHDDLNALETALLTTKKINWKYRTVFGVPYEHTDWFKSLTTKLGYNPKGEDPSDYFWTSVPRARRFKLELPDDVYLSPLKSEDISTVNSLWGHRFDGSESYLITTINMNYGLGIYRKTDDELLSWGLITEFGEIGALQTKFEHTQKGYASIIVKALTMVMSCSNELPLVVILWKNKLPGRMAKSMDAEYAGSYNWIAYEQS